MSLVRAHIPRLEQWWLTELEKKIPGYFSHAVLLRTTSTSEKNWIMTQFCNPKNSNLIFFLNFGICRKCKHCQLENGKFWSDQIFEFLVNFRPGNVWIPFYTTVLPIYLSIGRTREVVLFRQGACQVACLSRAVNLDHLTIRTFSKARSAKRSNGTTEKRKECNRTNHL